MKKFNLNLEIARHICLAQKNSELAKEYCNRDFKDEFYSEKRLHVETAINLMNKNINPKSCYFNYFIDECKMLWSGEYRTGQIVYFTFRGNDGKRLQISFHVPPSEIKRSRSYKGLCTKWDHKSSHRSCEELIKIFNLKISI